MYKYVKFLGNSKLLKLDIYEKNTKVIISMRDFCPNAKAYAGNIQTLDYL